MENVESYTGSFDMRHADRRLIHEIIDKVMKTKDRYVTLYFGPHGNSISVYPMTEDEEE